MGTAIPRPPEALPQMPAIIVVPITRPRSLGPGIFTIAFVITLNTGLLEATPPKPLTAQVFVIEKSARAAASAKYFGSSLTFICLYMMRIAQTAPARTPTSTGTIAFPSDPLRLTRTIDTIRGISEMIGLGSFSLGSSLKSSTSLATKCSPFFFALSSHILSHIMPTIRTNPQQIHPFTAPAINVVPKFSAGTAL